MKHEKTLKLNDDVVVNGRIARILDNGDYLIELTPSGKNAEIFRVSKEYAERFIVSLEPARY